MKALTLSLLVCLCAAFSAQAQTYQVSMSQLSGLNLGDVAHVELSADDDLTAAAIYSFQLSITIPNNLSFLDLQTTSTDLANGWFLSSNVVGNTLSIAGAGTIPLSGIGRMLTIRYNTINPGNYSLNFSPLSQCYFNEGTPSMATVNGSVQVNSPPNVYVSPSSDDLIIGESVTLSGSSGTAPYSFSSSDNAVLSVSGSQLTALTQGEAQVQATDANGYTSQNSGTFTVNTFDLDIGDATGAATQELIIPITLNNPSGASFYSGELTINGFNNLLLNGVNTNGFLTDGSIVQTSVNGSQLQLSFATANAITPATSGDVLLALRVAKQGGTSASYHTLSSTSALFDQSLTARTSNGFASFQGLPNIYVSPSPVTMLAGETQQFTVSSGAQAPLNWQVTNPSVGSIDANGLFIATNGGFTQITITDALSNSAITQTITINDMELSLIDVGGYIGGEVWLPLVAGPSVNNEDVFSYDLVFSYPSSQLSFIDYETNNTLSDGWFALATENNGTIQVSAAGATPFTPGGLIGYLRFSVDGMSNGQSAYVQILSSIFNQGDPKAGHINGYITANDASCGSTGCTNPYASNFDPNAVCDDGTCAFTAPAVLRVNAKAMLQGPFEQSSGLMKDDLRVAGLIPLNEPYTALGYGFVGGGGESVSSSVLTTTGNDAIVDWVVVEVRDANAPSSIVASASALIQRDGDIVDMDGNGKLEFAIPAQSYYLSIVHRNHLQIMSATAISPLTLDSGYDMSALGADLYGSEPVFLTANAGLMWAGDATFDSVLKYTGSANDRDPILVDIGGSVPTATISSYSTTDVNMDGVVKYTGSANDRDIILVNIGGGIPTAVRTAQLP